jgi:hypothetical protein
MTGVKARIEQEGISLIYPVVVTCSLLWRGRCRRTLLPVFSGRLRACIIRGSRRIKKERFDLHELPVKFTLAGVIPQLQYRQLAFPPASFGACFRRPLRPF